MVEEKPEEEEEAKEPSPPKVERPKIKFDMKPLPDKFAFIDKVAAPYQAKPTEKKEELMAQVDQMFDKKIQEP